RDFGGGVGAQPRVGAELGQAAREPFVVDIGTGCPGLPGHHQDGDQGRGQDRDAVHGPPPSCAAALPVTRASSAFSCFSVSTASRSLPSRALIAASSLLTVDSSARWAA